MGNALKLSLLLCIISLFAALAYIGFWGTPAATDTLVLADVGPLTLDPALSRETRSALYITQIFSGLVAFDEDMQLVPDIAERWDLSEDGLTYTFHLRSGAKFHDGRELKASDFKYSMERACDPQTGSQTAETYLGDIVGAQEMLAGKATEISGIKVIDDYTLEITIDAPKVYFLAKLTHSTAFVVDKANVESGPDWAEHPNGSGPFKLKEWRKDELIVLERNDLYYGEPAQVKYVRFELWAGDAMSMYENSEIDVTDVSLADIERVLDPTNPLNEELLSAPELSLFYVGFNVTEPPFDDARVRQAFSYAVDKDKIVDLVLKGAVARADGILPPGMPGYNENLQPLPFDVEKAKELIAESSYGDIANLPPITVTTSGYGAYVDRVLVALADMWQENLGVQVEFRQLDPEDYFYLLEEEKDELFEFGWLADYPDPENFLDVLFHSGGENNVGEYSNLELDALLEEAGIEQDSDARMAMYREAEQLIINDAACLPLYFGVNHVLVKPYVEGFVLNPFGLPLLKNVSIEPH